MRRHIALKENFQPAFLVFDSSKNEPTLMGAFRLQERAQMMDVILTPQSSDSIIRSPDVEGDLTYC